MLIERSNLERLMASAGLDAIIATDPSTVAALAGYRSWLDGQFRQFMVSPWGSGDLIRTYAIFIGDHPVTAIVDPLFARDAASAGAECWTYGDPARAVLVDSAGFGRTPEEAIARALKDRGVADGNIGLEADGVPPQWRELLAAQCPNATLRDCTTLLRLARSIKSPAHIAHLRNVTGTAANALAAALEIARPGARLGELADAYAEAAGSRGAAIEHFALSHNGGGIATDRSMTLTADTVTYLDHGCRTALAVSDAGTTLRLRPFTRDERLAFSALEAAISAGYELLASHATSSAVHTAMSERLSAFPGAIVQGHGVGIEIREYPILVPPVDDRLRDECVDVAADFELQAGMVVNLEASLFGLGDASLHIEHTYLITENGAEALVHSEIDAGMRGGGQRPIEKGLQMTTSQRPSIFPLSYILVNGPPSSGGELREMLDFLRNIGYQGIELDVAGASRIDLERLEACAVERDMAIPSLLTGGAYAQGLCLSSPNVSVRKKTVTRLISFLAVARRLDAILVVGLLQGLRTDEPNLQIASDRIVECLREVGAAAQEQGVQVVLEPVNHLQVGFNNSVGEVLTTIERVASPAVRPMIDTLHMHIEEHSPVRSVLDVGKKLRHVHLCESNGGLLGSGNADLPAVCRP